MSNVSDVLVLAFNKYEEEEKKQNDNNNKWGPKLILRPLSCLVVHAKRSERGWRETAYLASASRLRNSSK